MRDKRGLVLLVALLVAGCRTAETSPAQGIVFTRVPAADKGGPEIVDTIEGRARYHKQRWYEVPEWFELTFTYPGNIRVLCGQDNGFRGGCLFEGTRGKLYVTRGRIESDPPELLKQPLGEKDVRLTVSANHHANWLECVRSGRRPICDVEIGHRSATVCHLGGIALRSERPVRWDASKEIILGDEPTSALDPISSQNIEKRLVDLKHQYTTIIVTHTLRQAKRLADHIIYMYLGEVVEAGPAQEVFDHPQHKQTRAYLEGQI